MRESENYNNVWVGQDGADNAVAPIVVAEQEFMLIVNEDVAKLKLNSLRVELKKRGWGERS